MSQLAMVFFGAEVESLFSMDFWCEVWATYSGF
jgi:hypothetical protein